MGGQAFARLKSETPINVPRLSPDIYQQVAADVASKLETLFNHVTIPREAPGKTDFGDIDFLVGGIRASSATDIWLTVKTLLGAELHITNGDSHSFGIQHPSAPDAYVQVDVELKNAAELFEWTKFMKSDSDLLQIIGVIHRSLGLVCNDKGLHVRIEEVEPYDKKKRAMLFLTRDPNEVTYSRFLRGYLICIETTDMELTVTEALDFYGYDKAKYWQGFSDETDLFEWATNGRFFYWKLYEDRDENSNDRSRLKKRPMFRRFVHEFMPSSSKATRTSDTTNVNGDAGEEAIQAVQTWPSRREVLQEALCTFGKHKEYNAIILEHETNGVEEALWRQITDSLLLQGAALGITLKGLKRWVAFKDSRPYILEQPLQGTKLKWTNHFSRDAVPDVLAWIEENREQVRKLEEERADEARKMAMKGKGGT